MQDILIGWREWMNAFLRIVFPQNTTKAFPLVSKIKTGKTSLSKPSLRHEASREWKRDSICAEN